MTPTAIVPDLHADPARLDATLARVGDAPRIAFLGDLIDAGSRVGAPDDAAVLTRARALIEAGRASAIMGNHELNAVLYHHPDALRPRTDKNTAQHRSFLAAFGTATAEARAWTDWFLTLPLWRELDGLRLVHACWDEAAVETVAARRPDARLTPDDLPEVAAESTPFGRAVKRLVSGPEARLPGEAAFVDAGGHRRRDIRLAWWRGGAATWRDAALSVPRPAELPDTPLDATTAATIYPRTAPPVLVGHYKMAGVPRIEAPTAACLDYPATPCAYLWQGERRLTERNLVVV